MNLRVYQWAVLDGMFCKEGTDQIAHAALGLTGEAGEVADLVKKSQYAGRELDAKKMVEELGDVLWYLTFIAGTLGFELQEIASLNIEKLAARHPHLYAEYAKDLL